MPEYNADSPLSITASIAGLLTLLAAIAATLYARFNYLRHARAEYFRVKAALSWYKTESLFMQDLLKATYAQQGGPGGDGEREGGQERGQKEQEMYGFVVEELARIENRLLEAVEEAELGQKKRGLGEGREGLGDRQKGWTVVPRGIRGKTDIAISWLPVRTKALELVRQREALGSRVLFAQMSMISSRVKDQEIRSLKREEAERERLDRLELLVETQNEKLDRMEDLVYRSMHRLHVTVEKEPEHATYASEFLDT